MKEVNKEYCKNQFIEAYNQYIMPNYEGASELLDYLNNKTDFFSAPCSTRYHLCVEGGLVLHSLNVFSRLLKECQNEDYDINSNIGKIALVSLLHDLCKVNTYKKTLRNKKIDGQWKEVEEYEYSEGFTYGHGSKSVYIIMKFLKITDEEAQAIRFHMGGYEVPNQLEPYTGIVYPANKLALLLHLADMKATYIDEVE